MTAHCDNMAVVGVVNFGYSKHSMLTQLLRVLFFAKAQEEVEIKAGQPNVLADALSRNKMQLFFLQAPGVNREPTEVTTHLMELLVTVQPHRSGAV